MALSTLLRNSPARWIGNDDYTQAGNLFRLMTLDAQQRLIGNIIYA